MKRLLVTGSRHGWDAEVLADQLWNAHQDLGGGEVVLIHGDAAGVDSMAAEFWMWNSLGPVEAFPYIKKLGRAGGPVRNRQMVESGADLCVAFLDPDSRGTLNCAKQAEAAGIPVRRVVR